MKTHLPVALRKALLAALVAVSFSTYNQAFAYQVIINSNGMNVTFDDENGDGGDTVNSPGINVNVEGPIASDNNQIITGSAAVNALQGISGDGNSISTTSGNIKTGDISGANTSIMSESGNVEVGNITETATGTTIETNTGDLTTGDIAASDITVTMKGAGKLSTGVITGANVQMNAESATLSSLSSMSGTKLDVAGIGAPDTNATLNGSFITSAGNVEIGAPEADPTVPEADTLKLTNGSSIAATGDTATMTIDQNVSLAGASSLSTKGGDLTISENVTLAGGSSISSTGGNVEVSGQVQGTSSSISTVGDGSVILGGLASATKELSIAAENGDIKVGAIEGDNVDRVAITTNGSLSIGTSDNAALTNAQVSAGSGIVVGDTAGASETLDIRGLQGDAGSTLIETDGNLVVNQSVSIHPGDNESLTAGDVTVNAGGAMSFLGASTKIAGGDGNAAKSYVTANDSIEFRNEKGTEVAQKAKVESLSGDVTMTSGDSATNLIAGEVTSAGKVDLIAGSNFIWGTVAETAKVSAKSGIDIKGKGTSNGNGISTAIVTTESGGISMESEEFNTVFASEVSADKGDIKLNGGYVSATSSTIEAKDGAVSLIGTETAVASDTITASGSVTIAGTAADGNGTGIQDSVVTGDSISVGSASSKTTIGTLDDSDDKVTTLTATGDGKNVEVVGSSVGISGDSAITSKGGDVSIMASAGKASVTDGYVRAMNGSVQVAGTQGTNVSGVDVDGKTVAIGDSRSETVLGKNGDVSTTVVANTGDVTITGSTVSVQEKTGATAVTGSVTLNGGTQNAVTSSTVKAGKDVKLTGDQNTLNNVVTDATVSAGQDVGLEGKYNAITSASTVKSGQDVVMDAGENNVVTAASTVAATCNVDMTAGEGNYITTADVAVKAGQDVGLTAETANTISASTVTAAKGSLSLHNEADAATGVVNTITSGAKATAGTDVNLKGDINNIREKTEVTAVTGSVTLTGGTQNAVISSTVKAGDDVVMDSGENNVISGQAKVTALGSVLMDADGKNYISDAGTQVYAVETVKAAGADNVVNNEARLIGMQGAELVAETDNTITAGGQVLAMNDSASVSLTAGADNLISGAASKVYAGKDVKLQAESENMVYSATVAARTGDVSMGNAAGSTDDVVNTITGAAKVSATGNVTLTGEKNAIVAGSQVLGGQNVQLTGGSQNAVANATVTSSRGSISMSGADKEVKNVVTSETAATSLAAYKDVTLTGDNIITSADKSGLQTSIAAQNGSITLNEKNYIRNASMEARDIIVTTGAGKSTYIADSSLKGDTVSIAGDTRENLALVTGVDMRIESFGEDSGAGITLNNVSVQNTGKGNLIARNNGHIVIENRVDVFQGSLTIESGPSGAISSGRIEVEGSNVLNMKADSSLDGGLSGDGSINKSGGDELRLDRDHRGFSGTIYANGATGGPEGSVVDADNAGSWIQVTDAGVGEDARMVLKNTDLVIETTETQIGSLDTTQDAGANNTATGGTLGADASYTADGNNREDFKIIGSVVEVKKGVSGDVVHAANLTLSDATLLKLDAEVDAGGNASSDIIAATGTVDVAARAGLNSTSTAAAPSTARVYINHTDMAAAAQAAEGTRTTIMSGTMAGDINADVLYDVEKSANGTYQRRLKDRNVHLENKGDRVDLVFSKNYRSAAKDASMQTVADAIRQYSDAFHHTEGTLAAGNSQMEKLVDAFDYTRSEGAAQRGLQSVAGFGNVIPQLMLFDSSRHHLNNLRKQMDMPVCPRTWKGAPNRRSNAWVTYTGAHDSLNGDAHLGDYTRSAHGAMLGVDTSVNCKTRVGLSLGYESSSGEADGSKVDADTFFVDAYATAYTGHIKHRVSIGIATSSFDSRRAVEVEAGYHSFHGSSRADTDALTLNFGYEISADHRLNERSWLTRYAALNLSWHNLDDMREEGLDGVGLVTEFDKEWQADVALGLAYNREFAAVKYEAPAVFYANAAVHFELLADRAEATNRFNGAESGWKIESMEREQLYFELGAGVMVPLSPAWTATAGAAVEIGSDRTSFSGNVGVRYSF